MGAKNATGFRGDIPLTKVLLAPVRTLPEVAAFVKRFFAIIRPCVADTGRFGRIGQGMSKALHWLL